MPGCFNICKSIKVIHHINKTDDKDHVMISIDAGKAFDKIQHLLKIKSLCRVVTKGAYLNTRKATHDKPAANITLNSGKCSCKISIETRMAIPSTFSQYSTESPIRYEKEIKGIQIAKGEERSLSANYILYIENQVAAGKQSGLISEVSKVPGYKITALLTLKNTGFNCTSPLK